MTELAAKRYGGSKENQNQKDRRGGGKDSKGYDNPDGISKKQSDGRKKGTKVGGFGGTKNKMKGTSNQIDFANLVPEIIVDRKEKDGTSINDVVNSICDREGLSGTKEQKRVYHHLISKLTPNTKVPWVRNRIEIIEGTNVQMFSWNPNGKITKNRKWNFVKLKIKTHTKEKKAGKKKKARKNM